MYTIKKSSLKTDKEGVISSRKEIKKALKEALGEENWLYSFVDVKGDEHPFYINCEDTIVIKIPDNATVALKLAKFATRESVDEFHYFMTNKNEYIVCLWWD